MSNLSRQSVLVVAWQGLSDLVDAKTGGVLQVILQFCSLFKLEHGDFGTCGQCPPPTSDWALGAVEVVRLEPQPAQLFEIPPGFRKFDPQLVIERIKQSDVWVAGEKDSDLSHP